MTSKPVTIRFVGDESKFRATTEAVGGRLKGFGKQAEEEGRRAGEGFDRAAEGADSAENKAQGLASTLTGTKDTMAGVGMIARGDLFNGLVMTGQGAADLAEGLNYTVIPALKGAATAFTRSGIATVRDTASKVTNAVVSKASAAATWTMTIAQRALNLAMRANPIGLVITAIMLIVGALVRWYATSQRARDIINGAFNAIRNAAMAVWDWIRGRWPLLLGILTGPIGLAVLAIVRNFDRIKRIPGEMFDVGRRIVQGIIDGIRSMVGAVGNAVSSVAQTVRNFLPFSPAKEGPLSGSGSPFIAGQNIARMISQGMLSGRPGAGASLGSLLAPAAVLGRPGAASGYTITVNARTNADAAEIAREVAWAMRTSGR